MDRASSDTAARAAPPPTQSAWRMPWRFGAMLLAPRRTASALEPTEGQRDGWALGLLYLFGAHTYPLIEATAGALAVRNLNGFIMLFSALGRALLAPILVLVVAETILGRARAHRRGVCLLPLIVVGTIAHALVQNGTAIPGPSYLPALVGGALGALLAVWIRPVVEPEEDDG